MSLGSSFTSLVICFSSAYSVEAVGDDEQRAILGQVERDGIRLDARVLAVQVGTERAHDAARPCLGACSAVISPELTTSLSQEWSVVSWRGPSDPVRAAIAEPAEGDALAVDEHADSGRLRRRDRFPRPHHLREPLTKGTGRSPPVRGSSRA